MGTRIRPARPRAIAVIVLLTLALLLTACGPEDGRPFGAGKGSGADPDNRKASVELHGNEDRDARIYYETPREAPGT